MDETEILTTIAQLAIGVAGFSGVAIAFKRQPGKLVDVEAFRIAILFSNAFAAMFISLLPFPLHAIFNGADTVWRMGSGVIAIFTAFFLKYYLGKTRRFRREIPELFNPIQLVMTRSGHVCNILLQTANAAGLFRDKQSAVFIFGILWLLFHSTFQFGRMLFVQPPTWYIEKAEQLEAQRK